LHQRRSGLGGQRVCIKARKILMRVQPMGCQESVSRLALLFGDFPTKDEAEGRYGPSCPVALMHQLLNMNLYFVRHPTSWINETLPASSRWQQARPDAEGAPHS
jgi:hypothetical protein